MHVHLQTLLVAARCTGGLCWWTVLRGTLLARRLVGQLHVQELRRKPPSNRRNAELELHIARAAAVRCRQAALARPSTPRGAHPPVPSPDSSMLTVRNSAPSDFACCWRCLRARTLANSLHKREQDTLHKQVGQVHNQVASTVCCPFSWHHIAAWHDQTINIGKFAFCKCQTRFWGAHLLAHGLAGVKHAHDGAHALGGADGGEAGDAAADDEHLGRRHPRCALCVCFVCL